MLLAFIAKEARLKSNFVSCFERECGAHKIKCGFQQISRLQSNFRLTESIDLCANTHAAALIHAKCVSCYDFYMTIPVNNKSMKSHSICLFDSKKIAARISDSATIAIANLIQIGHF